MKRKDHLGKRISSIIMHNHGKFRLGVEHRESINRNMESTIKLLNHKCSITYMHIEYKL